MGNEKNSFPFFGLLLSLLYPSFPSIIMSAKDAYKDIIMSKPTTCRRMVGKNCIVTAGSRGIGLAIAMRLAQEGGNVIICSRKEKNVKEALARAKSERNVSIDGKTCNVTSDEDLKAFVEYCAAKFQNRIDVIISNVGVNPQAGSTFALESKTYDKVMNANVRSHWM